MSTVRSLGARPWLSLALLSALPLGALLACGGKAGTTKAPDGGMGTMQSGAGATQAFDSGMTNVTPSTDAGFVDAAPPDGGSVVDGAPTPDAAVDSAIAPQDAGGIAIPGVFADGSCTTDSYTIPFISDAGEGPPCNFTAAGVACESASDCKTYVLPGCSCFEPVLGLNVAVTEGCVPPPCVAGLTCSGDGLVAQDCTTASNASQVTVACVEHRCMTSAGVGSE